jgi:hypothetical protein
MAENDPSSLLRASPRQASHGAPQPTFKRSWIKGVFALANLQTPLFKKLIIFVKILAMTYLLIHFHPFNFLINLTEYKW